MSLNNFAWVENLKEQPFIPCVITFDKDLLCTQSFYIACLALMSAHMQFCLGYMQNNGDDCQCTQWRSSQICCSPGKLLQCLNPRYHHMRKRLLIEDGLIEYRICVPVAHVMPQNQHGQWCRCAERRANNLVKSGITKIFCSANENRKVNSCDRPSS